VKSRPGAFALTLRFARRTSLDAPRSPASNVLSVHEVPAHLSRTGRRRAAVPAGYDLHEHYRRLVEKARQAGDLSSSHSVDEADERHDTKRRSGAGG
jgi:hypothetical protein